MDSLDSAESKNYKRKNKMIEKCKTLKLLKPLGLFVAIIPLVFLFGGCSGWGWFVPYSFQPSYYKFKKMCKLNKLPNNEEKYNKVLGYFGKSLDSLDWDELNKKTKKLQYKSEYEYVSAIDKQISPRIYMLILMYGNESIFNRENIRFMQFVGDWDTGRKVLYLGHEGNMRVDFVKKELNCNDFNIYHNLEYSK